MPHVRLDFPDLPGPVVFTDPVEIVRAGRLAEVVPALEAVREAGDGGLHAVGFVAYEAAPALEPAMTVRPPSALPLVWFGLFDAADPGDGIGPERAERAGIEPAASRGGGPTAGDHRLPWQPELTRAEHARAVADIREAIAEGRTYQVNLTARLRAPFDGDPEALYHRLRHAQGAGWHALLDTGRHVIASASPELFFETRGRAITTRPMKGTRPRGRWPAEDRALADALRASPKDRAENLMIVDLIRNDLGRVCRPGAVRVPVLWEVEGYRTVWQLTSTVAGTLRDDVGLVDLFRALFPCGSVTGAPKISTMEVIAGLERSPREVYCGAIGWVRPGGDCTFNVPIRTVWVDRGRDEVAYGAGGGIVWDSTPEAEWDELVAKTAVAGPPWPAFRLLETLATRDGRPVRLDRHLDRMADSARRFDFRFPADDVRAAILQAAARDPEPRRLRVTVGPDGDVDIESQPLRWTGAPAPDYGRAPPSDADHVPPEAADSSSPTATDHSPATAADHEPPTAADHEPPTAANHEPPTAADYSPDAGAAGLRKVVLARSPVDPADPFLYHKTTHRDVYDRHLAEAPDDAFDVLLWNEAGDLTEFCRGNVVAAIDGRLVTPPVAAGLLAGCLRAELLERDEVTETPIAVDDLADASELWFVNSARGWVRVRLS
ncbi:MAG: aminodeoxychorismate synthase component I [Longimicrobiales bacterium]|nr:aminodeoxychorismate synthase component I [Longimicrobiales bacterium]